MKFVLINVSSMFSSVKNSLLLDWIDTHKAEIQQTIYTVLT